MNDIAPITFADPSVEICDFGHFKISERLRVRLEAAGNFSCDELVYGFPATSASGQLDGYRWLFSAHKTGDQCLFFIFAKGGAQEVTFENKKTLSYEESWCDCRDIDPPIDGGMLSHEGVFLNILKSVKKFMARRPFQGK